MNDKIKAGMYRGTNEMTTKQISLDRRTVKIKDGDGDYTEAVALDYVRSLENQILELRRALDISVRTAARQELRIKRLEASMKKVGSKLG